MERYFSISFLSKNCNFLKRFPYQDWEGLGAGWKKLEGGRYFGITLLFVILLLTSACQKQDVKGGKYHCPMHPTYIADKTGRLPHLWHAPCSRLDMKSATPEVMKYEWPPCTRKCSQMIRVPNARNAG